MTRPTREEIQAERVAAGLHPKAGWQSLAESRRVLMTWTKAELVEFYLREESDALKATDRAIAAEMALREHRAEALTMPKPTVKRPISDPARKEAFERWMHQYSKGSTLDAEQVFIAGWDANSRSAVEATQGSSAVEPEL